jgi:hypothetical protein
MTNSRPRYRQSARRPARPRDHGERHPERGSSVPAPNEQCTAGRWGRCTRWVQSDSTATPSCGGEVAGDASLRIALRDPLREGERAGDGDDVMQRGAVSVWDSQC